MEIKIENNIRPDEFLDVMCSVGWDLYTKEQAIRSLNNSMCMVKAIVDGKVVGIGRAVGDSCISCLICNVCVKPEYQRKGIGLRIVNELKEEIRKCIKKGDKMFVELTPVAGKEELYIKAGFKYNPKELTGMYLWIEK